MNRRYNGHHDFAAVATFDGMSSHVFESEIDSAIIEIVETALPYLQKIMGGTLSPDLQGLLGCWSWMDGDRSQICLWMEHAKHKRGYFIAHEIAHLLHYSIRPDLFKKKKSYWENISRSNLTEMIAHAGGLSFAPYAPEITETVTRLECLYQEKGLDAEFLLDKYYFSDDEDEEMEETHAPGYQAAEFILSLGVSIRRFVFMDVVEAEVELRRLGYSRELYSE